MARLSLMLIAVYIYLFLKVRFLAKPKRINSLWSFGLTKSFIKLAAVRHLSKLYALTLHYYYLKQSESYYFKDKEGRFQSRVL